AREDSTVRQGLHSRHVESAPFRYCLNKLLMHIVHNGLKQLVLFIIHLPEWGSDILESSTFDHDTLNPDLLEQPFDVSHLHNDPDAARQRPCIGHNPIGRNCNIVSS